MKRFTFSLKCLTDWPFMISSVLLLAVCLTGILKFTGPLNAIHAVPPAPEKEWTVNTHYKVNDLVTYQGKTYACILEHTSQSDWNPIITTAILWTPATGNPSPPPNSPPIGTDDQSTFVSTASSPKTFTGGCTSGPQDMWTPADGVFFQGRTDKARLGNELRAK